MPGSAQMHFLIKAYVGLVLAVISTQEYLWDRAETSARVSTIHSVKQLLIS